MRVYRVCSPCVPTLCNSTALQNGMRGGETGKRGRHRRTSEAIQEAILEGTREIRENGTTLEGTRGTEMTPEGTRETEMTLGTAGEIEGEMPTEEGTRTEDEMRTGAEMRGAERYGYDRNGWRGGDNAV